MACTERCACRTLSQSARGTALSKSFLKLEHPTFWIQQKARRWEGMNNHCCSVWVKTYPCPAEPRLIVRATARAAGRRSGRATAPACVCTAAEVSSACICVWLERRTSAAQSETASAALLTKHRQERAVPAPRRMVVGPCVLLSLGWMDVALQPLCRAALWHRHATTVARATKLQNTVFIGTTTTGSSLVHFKLYWVPACAALRLGSDARLK